LLYGEVVSVALTPRKDDDHIISIRKALPGSSGRQKYDQCYTRSMKTAVSIPDRVFQSAEKLAARLGVSRSQLYADALAALVEKHSEVTITSQLNELYGPGGEEPSLDREVTLLQSRSLARDRW